jgi:hypothetical protein
MKKTLIILAVILGALLVLLGITGLSAWSYVGNFYDSANKTRIASYSKEKEAKQVYDKVWKTITQKAQINNKYAEDFKEIFTSINDKRYGDKNPAMMWITEQNPTLDPNIYRELSQSIEANRNEYLATVKEQISIAQEHNTKVSSSGSYFPCMIIKAIGHPNKVCDTLNVLQVTSNRTEESFKTGIDDNTELFPKK